MNIITAIKHLGKFRNFLTDQIDDLFLGQQLNGGINVIFKVVDGKRELISSKDYVNLYKPVKTI